MTARNEEHEPRSKSEFISGLESARQAVAAGEVAAVAYLLDEEEKDVVRVSTDSKPEAHSFGLDPRTADPK